MPKSQPETCSKTVAISITLQPPIAKRLAALAKKSRRSVADYTRGLILDDLQRQPS